MKTIGPSQKIDFDKWIKTKGKWVPLYLSAIAVVISLVTILIRLLR